MNLTDLAAALGGELHGDGSLEVRAPKPPHLACAEDLAVAMDPALLGGLADSKARVALVSTGAELPDGAVDAWVSVGRARYAMARLTRTFDAPARPPAGIHPAAVVEQGALVAPDAAIGPFCHIGAGAEVGAGSVLLGSCTLGPGAKVGAQALLHPGVRIGAGVTIGVRAIIHANAAIGNDGFSFVTPEPGNVESAKQSGTVSEPVSTSTLARIHSLGAVTIGDDVEIGANTCIDRGTLEDTRIGDGTKIDDLVMIGHNVQVGRSCMLCAQVGIAGSSRIGNGVVLAGRVGVADHITIGDYAVIGAGSGVGNDVPKATVYVGYPAAPKDVTVETYMYTRRLKSLFKDVAALKKRVRSLPVSS